MELSKRFSFCNIFPEPMGGDPPLTLRKTTAANALAELKAMWLNTSNITFSFSQKQFVSKALNKT
jgi:hypothetical protein